VSKFVGPLQMFMYVTEQVSDAVTLCTRFQQVLGSYLVRDTGCPYRILQPFRVIGPAMGRAALVEPLAAS
jgi:hypothetical protein